MTSFTCVHVPAIVHRTGGPPADRLNTCGICGCYISLQDDGETWTELSQEEADRVRNQWRR